MCKEDLKAALSSTNRGKNVPLICWDDALQRSKTIDLKEEDNVSKVRISRAISFFISSFDDKL